ncbi:MAG: ABC transporter substrate-binding protein [Thermomicrobiales bacterium]|nr:ABC transporter substrate-binding protein [Thermomicrobiales bacterium]
METIESLFSSRRGRGSSRLALLAVALLLLLVPLLTACGGDDDGAPAAATSTSAETSTSPDASNSAEPRDTTIGLSFVPNIQFAPFYVAIEKGFYADHGLNVDLNHHQAGADLFGALVAGQEDAMMAGGDEVLSARAKGAELVYVAEVFTTYPIGLIVPADSGIESVADIKGKKVGIPGPYGATYIGLLALLAGSGLTADDVQVESIGFTQAAALLAGHVDAVIGYVNNEPLQLQKAGMETRTFPVSEVRPLISNGIVVTEAMLNDNPDVARAIVAATLEGVQYTLDHPDEALEIAKKFVPTLTDAQQVADAKAVLEASLPLWQPTTPPGASNADDWQSMAEFLTENGLLDGEVDASAAFTNDLVE